MNVNSNLKGKRIIVTGCGYKKLQHRFYDIVTGEASHNAIFVNGTEMKLNIGAAIAYILAEQGAIVHMVSTTEEKLKNIKNDILEKTGCKEENIEYSVVNLLDEKSVSDFVDTLIEPVLLFICSCIPVKCDSDKRFTALASFYYSSRPPSVVLLGLFCYSSWPPSVVHLGLLLLLTVASVYCSPVSLSIVRLGLLLLLTLVSFYCWPGTPIVRLGLLLLFALASFCCSPGPPSPFVPHTHRQVSPKR